MFRLDDKTALVTGAASGIGRAIAHLFAAQGAFVALADVYLDAVAREAAAIESAGGHALALRLDVTDLDAAHAAVAAVVDRHGRLDILVNNAGLGLAADLLDTTPADYRRIMAVNADGVYHCSLAAVAQMVAQTPKGGVIVNVASVGGLVAVPHRFAYCASKGAVVAMTKSTAVDYVADNIRCNCICPAKIDTPLVRGHLMGMPTDEAEQTERAFHARQPLGRMGHPEEVAALALYLASDEAAFVTGAQMVIDGGVTAM